MASDLAAACVDGVSNSGLQSPELAGLANPNRFGGRNRLSWKMVIYFQEQCRWLMVLQKENSVVSRLCPVTRLTAVIDSF